MSKIISILFFVLFSQTSILFAQPDKFVELVPLTRECIEAASERQLVPLRALYGILAVEGGWVGLKKENGGVSARYRYDYGPFQINTFWLNKLSEFGICENLVRYNGCVNAHIAAWILRLAIEKSGGDIWKGIGRYHNPGRERANWYINLVHKRTSGVLDEQKLIERANRLVQLPPPRVHMFSHNTE